MPSISETSEPIQLPFYCLRSRREQRNRVAHLRHTLHSDAKFGDRRAHLKCPERGRSSAGDVTRPAAVLSERRRTLYPKLTRPEVGLMREMDVD